MSVGGGRSVACERRHYADGDAEPEQHERRSDVQAWDSADHFEDNEGTPWASLYEVRSVWG